MAYGFKSGGRNVGTPNKKSQKLTELIENKHKNFDPVLEMIDIYKDKKTPLDIKVNILKDITPYIYPKRKSIEADIIADTNIGFNNTLESVIEKLLNNTL